MIFTNPQWNPSLPPSVPMYLTGAQIEAQALPTKYQHLFNPYTGYTILLMGSFFICVMVHDQTVSRVFGIATGVLGLGGFCRGLCGILSSSSGSSYQQV